MNNAIEHVVLLHGLSRSSAIMEKMAEYLRIHGYVVHNLDYPSTKQPIETLAETLYQKIQRLGGKGRCLHLVGHSLGAILIRRILQQHQIVNQGRVVMLGVPNHGSEVVQLLQRFRFYRRIYGPAGCQLGIRDNVLLESLPDANYECGIIAGDRCTLVDKFFSWFLFGDSNDGKVRVESTKLQGMKDHLVLPTTHAQLPSYPEVMRQTAFFLAQGYFEKS